MNILLNSESDEGEFNKDYLSLYDSIVNYIDEALSESESGDSKRGGLIPLNQVVGEMLVCLMRVGLGTLWHQMWI